MGHPVYIYWYSYKITFILVRFYWNSDLLDRFLENIQMSNFMELHPVGVELLHTDGRTWSKITVAFRNLANAPKYENTHFMFTYFFFFRKCKKKKYCRKLTGHRWHMAHVYCMLDDKGYKHSLRISLCSSYCFSTTTMVARTRTRRCVIRIFFVLLRLLYCAVCYPYEWRS